MGAAIAAAIFARRAAVATEATVRIAQEASEGAEEALAIATRNAEAAAAQVQVSEDTAKRQLRAYLNVDKLQATVFPNHPWRVAITFINSGKTPASNVRVRHNVAMLSKPYDPETLWEGVTDLPKSSGIVGGGREMSILEPALHVPEDIYHRIVEETADVIAFGDVEYTDIFGEIHVATYRYRIDPHGLWNFTVCEGGNETT